MWQGLCSWVFKKRKTIQLNFLIKTTPIHQNNFNFLRLIGALLVIISHSFDITGKSNSDPLFQLTGKLQSSGIGLTIFFFISGYFVTASANNTAGIGRFIIKRVMRIYPALIVLVFISVFFAGPLLSTLPTYQYFQEKDSWVYLFTTTGLRIRMNLPGVFSSPNFQIKAFNASLWTIALEIQLYISITLALWIGIVRNKNLFAALCLLIVFICFGIVAFNQDVSFTSARHLNLIALFYLGGFVYIAALTKKMIYIILLFSTLLYVAFTFFKILEFDPFILCLLSISMLTYCLGFTKRFQILLTTDISYGLYIYAFPVQQTIFMFSGITDSWILVLTSIVCTLPLAFASWHFIEKKFIVKNVKL